jgi:hypothetical protein
MIELNTIPTKTLISAILILVCKFTGGSAILCSFAGERTLAWWLLVSAIVSIFAAIVLACQQLYVEAKQWDAEEKLKA